METSVRRKKAYKFKEMIEEVKFLILLADMLKRIGSWLFNFDLQTLTAFLYKSTEHLSNQVQLCDRQLLEKIPSLKNESL